MIRNSQRCNNQRLNLDLVITFTNIIRGLNVLNNFKGKPKSKLKITRGTKFTILPKIKQTI